MPSQWFFWGFSLAFSETGNAFIGDLSEYAVLVTMNDGAHAICRIFRSQRSARKAVYRQYAYPIHRFLRVPAYVRRNYVCIEFIFSVITAHIEIGCQSYSCHRSCRRAITSRTSFGLCLHLVNHCI